MIRIIQVLLYSGAAGDEIHDPKGSYQRKFEKDLTEEDIESCVTEVGTFLREVLKPKTYPNPLYDAYKNRKKMD